MLCTGSMRKCGTCDYWSGNREIVNFGNQCEFENNDRGSCNEPNSSSRLNENKTAQMSCPKWRKWGQLK
jgi:hypothetical protein